MKIAGRTLLACTCRGTMPLEADGLARACGASADGPMAHELCRAEIGRFRDALARTREEGSELLVACTQEAPTFRRVQDEDAPEGDGAGSRFFNIRETAGWSSEAGQALPKIAALIAEATHWADPAPAPPPVSLRSEGVTVIYGRDDRAVEAAEQLKDRLDLTVIVTGGADLAPPRFAEFPVVRGTITRAKGYLGAFELGVDGFAQALPSSRRVLEFGPARDGATSRCDLILDLSGGQPLFPAHEHRDGYVRASPDDPVAVQKALLAASDLVGTFSKPRYVALDPGRCAHMRSNKVGCTRCLGVCPTGAITPAGDHVAIDPYVCAGCGTCAAVCPDAAITYTAQTAERAAEYTAGRLRTLLSAYRRAGGGDDPVLLVHDERHGAPLIEMLARHGDGLPARVIPVPASGEPGLDFYATAFAFGAAEIRTLVGRREQARRDAVAREAALAGTVMAALGYGEGRLDAVVADDPFELADALAALPRRPGPRPAAYLPIGDKPALTRQALDALHEAAPTPLDAVSLPAGAPIGRVHVDAPGCTLCLSCVSACPTSALRDGGDERPMLKFVEDACIQCGLCRSTCPENVVSLEPRALFGPARLAPVVLKEEEPAICIRCATPFGTKASIERVIGQLAGRHWMFKDPALVDRIRMCADCRVVAQARSGLDPYAGPPRPVARTADDYRTAPADGD